MAVGAMSFIYIVVSSMHFLIVHVLGMRTVVKISNAVIHSVTVFVPHYLPIFRQSYESLGDKVVDLARFQLAARTQNNDWIRR